jgi:hypothetical protein
LGQGRLRQLIAYGVKVFGLRHLLAQQRDGRQDPAISAPLIAAVVFMCGLLRVRSFNALEPKLGERPFLHLIGATPPGTIRTAARRRAARVETAVRKLCSIDTVGRALDVGDLARARELSGQILAKAERNKVFREGWIGGLRYAAIDGWEPFCSRHRRCDRCLTRHVRVTHDDGTSELVPEYYHRCVVAMLIDERLDLVLDFEPLLPADLRPDKAKRDTHEGEETAAKRLVARLKQRFPWIDVIVADGLYPNGPFLNVVAAAHLSAVVVLQKDSDEPLREARALWGDEPPAQVIEDKDRGERIELWDCPKVRTLSTYDGPIRVVRARITRLDEPQAKPHEWCIAVTGRAATRLSARQVLRVARARWHLENTGFHQWTKHWKLGHVFRHTGTAIEALFWYFFAAYDLLTLFLYRQLRCYGRDRGKDVTATISRLVDELLDDLARLTASPWDPG